MIPLTRIRHGEVFYLNPDLFERVDTHVDTAIRLSDGTEYVVTEPAEEIVRLIVEYRARIIAIAGMMQANAAAHESKPGTIAAGMLTTTTTRTEPAAAPAAPVNHDWPPDPAEFQDWLPRTEDPT